MKYLLLVAIGFFPFLSSAATYHYVNSQGITDTVEAPDANTAMAIAPDIAPNSGVALDQGIIDPGEVVVAPALNAFGYQANAGSNSDGSMETFHYVTADGITETVTAPDANTAIAIAPNIANNSGVAIDQGIIEPGMEVESVN